MSEQAKPTSNPTFDEYIQNLAKQIQDGAAVLRDNLKKQREEYIQKANIFGGLAHMGMTPFRRGIEEAAILRLYDTNPEFRDKVREIAAQYDKSFDRSAGGQANPNTATPSNAGGK